MRLGSLLEAERGFAPVASVRVAAGQEAGFGNPYAVFVSAELHFGERNDHRKETLTRSAVGVKRTFDG